VAKKGGYGAKLGKAKTSAKVLPTADENDGGKEDDTEEVPDEDGQEEEGEEVEWEDDGEDLVELSLDDPDPKSQAAAAGPKSLLKSKNSQRAVKKVSKRSKAETVVSSGCVLTDSMMQKHVGDTSDKPAQQGEVSAVKRFDRWVQDSTRARSSRRDILVAVVLRTR